MPCTPRQHEDYKKYNEIITYKWYESSHKTILSDNTYEANYLDKIEKLKKITLKYIKKLNENTFKY